MVFKLRSKSINSGKSLQAFFLYLFYIGVFTQAIAQVSPGGVGLTNVQVWLKADSLAPAADLPTWPDKSGKGNHAKKFGHGVFPDLPVTFKFGYNFNPVLVLPAAVGNDFAFLQTKQGSEAALAADFTTIVVFASAQSQGNQTHNASPNLISTDVEGTKSDFSLGFSQGKLMYKTDTTNTFEAASVDPYALTVSKELPVIALFKRPANINEKASLNINGKDYTDSSTLFDLSGKTTTSASNTGSCPPLPNKYGIAIGNIVGAGTGCTGPVFGNPTGGDPGNAAAQFEGTIAEVIIFDKTLSLSEYQRIESYLAIKYGVTLNQSTAYDYLNSAGVPVWTASINGAYNHNITGIARDNASGLAQYKSTSFNPTTSSPATGNITLTNGASSATPANLIDGQYLVWADNGGSISGLTASAANIANSRVNRIWKVQETGNIGTVTISISKADYNAAALAGMGYLLVSSTDDFAAVAAYKLVDVGSEYEAHVKLANGDFFSFGKYCPSITNPIGAITMCDGHVADEISVSTTAEGTNAISFVYFTTQQTGAAMYTGGTVLGTVSVPTGGGIAKYTPILSDFRNTGATVKTFYVYAKLSTLPADATCRPFQEIKVVVNQLPAFSATAQNVSCNVNTPNADGKIMLDNISNATKYDYNIGTTYTGTADFNSATAIPPSNTIVSNLGNPAVSQVYTVRLFNAQGCVADKNATLSHVTCTPSFSCATGAIAAPGGALFNEDFNAGSNTTDANVQNHVYNDTPAEGQYVVTNGNGGDHTGNTGGRHLFVNIGGIGNIYKRTVSGLCPGVKLTFSIYIKSHHASPNGAYLSVNLIDGATTQTINTADFGGDGWRNFTAVVTPTGSSLTIEINSNKGADVNGNEVSLDDIVLSHCGPAISISPADPTVIESCNSLVLTENGALTGALGYQNPKYQWQKLVGATWTNLADGSGITGTKTDKLSISGVKLSDAGVYRVLVGETDPAVADSKCITISTTTTVTVLSKPAISPANVTVCEQSGTVNYSTTALLPASTFTYAWLFGSNASPAAAGNVTTVNNVSWAADGNKTITLTITSNSCSTNVTAAATVNPMPSYKATTANPTCSGITPNNDGKIILSAFSAGSRFGFSSGTVYTGPANYSSATNIPVNGIIVATLNNPVTVQQYIIRVFNSTDCYKDTIVTINHTDCYVPSVGVAKFIASIPAYKPDGSYDITFKFTIKNYGNEALKDVELNDNLTAAFAAPSTYTLIGVPSVTGGSALQINSLYNGSTVVNLLQSTSTLAINKVDTITLKVNVKLNGNYGIFKNSATVKATGNITGGSVTDDSVNGNNPDKDGNGNPANDVSTTNIDFPGIGIAKRYDGATLNNNGTYDLTFTYLVKNFGEQNLTDIKLYDNLDKYLTGGATFNNIIVTTPGTGNTLVVNNNYKGNAADSNLLKNTSALAIGKSFTVRLVVRVNPHGFFGPFYNAATAEADGTGGLITKDFSTQGSNPDVNNNNNPNEAADNNLTGPFNLTPSPKIGLAKRVISQVRQSNGTYDVTYMFIIKNMGNADLLTISLLDTLKNQIPSPASFVVNGAIVASGSLASNALYDGSTLNNNLLNPLLSTLAIGKSDSVKLMVTITPNGSYGTFYNSAHVKALDTKLQAVADVSGNGAEVDKNGNGDPDEAMDNDKTPLLLENLVIGVAKYAYAPVLQGNGSYDVKFVFTLKNLGNQALQNVQLFDTLSKYITSPATYSVSSRSATGSLTTNGSYIGSGNNTNILAPGSSLAVGKTDSVLITISINPQGNFGPFFNTATAKANGGSNGLILTSDVSDNGRNTDSNGNGNPNEAGENDPTGPINLNPKGVVGLAKRLVSVSKQAGGSYDITFSYVIKNMGNANLTNVALFDTLSTYFPSPVTFFVKPGIQATGNLVADNSYTGINPGICNLLKNNSTLAVNKTDSLRFTINVIPNGNYGPFKNSATVEAVDPKFDKVTDVSGNGADVDKDKDGNPNEIKDNDPTPIPLLENVLLGIAKRADKPQLNADGSYHVTFLYTLKNYGNLPLQNIKLEDTLTKYIPLPATYSIISRTPSGGLSVNSAYDGTETQSNILAGTSSLAIGKTDSVRLVVKIIPNGNFGPFYNSATGTASGAGSSGTVKDVSTDGNNPDPNGNGNPADLGENVPTGPIDLSPKGVIGLAKRVTKATKTSGGYDVTYVFILKNMGNTDLKNVRLLDTLTNYIKGGASYTVANVSASGLLKADASYQGTVASPNMLTSNSELAVNKTDSVTLTIAVSPNGNYGPFSNSAVVRAKDSKQNEIWDISGNGINVDKNSNGEPNETVDNDPTDGLFLKNTALGIAKRLESIKLKPDDSYDVTFSFVLKNIGNQQLQNVELRDTLSKYISLPATYSVASGGLTGTLPVNSTYNGTPANSNLLAANVVLGVGATDSIRLVINIKPNGNFGPFFNSAKGIAYVPADNITVTDISTNGSNPDPNGNGNPGDTGEDIPTGSVLLQPKALLGLAKRVVSVVKQANNVYDVTYCFTLKNMGNSDLKSISLLDTLSNYFKSPVSYSINGPVLVSGKLVADVNYTGANSLVNLLLPTSTLAVNTTDSVRLTIRLSTNGNFGPFYNSAVAKAKSVNDLVETTDISGNGKNVDKNNNGIPNELPDNDRTPLFIDNLVLGVAKRLASVTSNANGSYDVVFSFVLKNYGNQPLQNITLLDTLSKFITPPATYTIPVNGVQSATLPINPGYDGSSGNASNLLGSNASLAIGQADSLTLKVNIVANGGFSSFSNRATAEGKGPGGIATVRDNSTNGSNPDPNGNGNPGDVGENIATPVTFPAKPLIGLAKRVVFAVKKSSNTYDIGYVFVLKNMGNADLKTIELYDTLSNYFKVPFTVKKPIESTGNLLTDLNYDGNNNPNILLPTSTLAVGKSDSIGLTVTVTTDGKFFGPFYNSAVVKAVSEKGALPTTDISGNGANVDKNNNGIANEAVDNDRTPITLDHLTIGLAKRFTKVTPNNDASGSFNVTYVFILKNMGNVDLTNIALNDVLANYIKSPSTFTIQKLLTKTSGGLVANSTYDGTINNSNMLASSSKLAIGVTDSVSLTINLIPNGNMGPYTNSATAEGRDAKLSSTTDISGSGANVDKDGNGEPNEAMDNDPTLGLFLSYPIIGVAKRVEAPDLQSDGSYNINYTFVLKNCGNQPLQKIQLLDTLANYFKQPLTTFKVLSNKASGGLTVNVNYNGTAANSNLLTDASSLPVNKLDSVKLTLNIKLNGVNSGTFYNSATAIAIEPAGIVTSIDVSTDGGNPDPNGNGYPDDAGESKLTGPVLILGTPVIGLAKQLSGVAEQSNHSYNVSYKFVVKNLCGDPLKKIQVSDSLAKIFQPCVVTVVSLKTANKGLKLNDLFTGKNPYVNMLDAANSTLQAGVADTIYLVLNIVTGDAKGPFANTALAQAVNANNVLTKDWSNNGINVDPNGNGVPNDADEDVPTGNLYFDSNELFIPDAFSPNADNVNDKFVIRGIYSYPGNNLKVFNRWGDLVFEANDYKNEWTGTASTGALGGVELPNGTYFYVLDLKNNLPVKKGYIVISK